MKRRDDGLRALQIVVHSTAFDVRSTFISWSLFPPSRPACFPDTLKIPYR